MCFEMVGACPSMPYTLDGYGILAQAEMRGVWEIFFLHKLIPVQLHIQRYIMNSRSTSFLHCFHVYLQVISISDLHVTNLILKI